jgi:hypothetical protein
MKNVGLGIIVFAFAACGPHKNMGGDDTGGGTDAKQYLDAPCDTSISGKVYAPNGTLALYNVMVYAPIEDPPPFPAGVQCGRCATTPPGGAHASAQSGPDGTFTLSGIPAGTNVPVIITTGKWRRKFTVPTVTACQNTAIPDGELRLPRNRSEGEMPRIAIVTGGCDPLACIFAKLGIDRTEFSSSSASAASVVFYNGVGGVSPGVPAASTALHGNLEEMKKFDVIVNSCECNEHNENKGSPDLLRQYADLGGRVLGSHFHYTWSKNLIPQWQSLATWTATGGAGTTPDKVDMTHPTGMALAQWLVGNGGSPSLGDIELGTKTPNATTINPGGTRWLHAATGAPPTTHYMSWNTPVGTAVENQCGKVVYMGMHVSAGSTVNASFPTGCTADLKPDEKAFVFLFFDLTTCIGPIF